MYSYPTIIAISLSSATLTSVGYVYSTSQDQYFVNSTKSEKIINDKRCPKDLKDLKGLNYNISFSKDGVTIVEYKEIKPLTIICEYDSKTKLWY